MRKVLHAQSTLTDRYQTTIPEPIRKALHLGKSDKIDFAIEDSGKVVLTRVTEDDPVLGDFLSFLANDIQEHPEHIQFLNRTLVKRAQSLASGIDVDLDASLSEEDE